MKTINTILILLLLLSSNNIWSADANGKFAVRNAGMIPCHEFINQKEKKSATYNLYMGWIDGYLSASNQYIDNTYDLVPWGNTVLLAELLANHCKNNLNQRFYIAVNQLAGVLLKQRLKKHSELIETSYNGNKSYIYQAVLLQVQQQLKKENFYNGKFHGKFDKPTRKSLEAYQKAKKLAITGLPDQLTLYMIFKGIAAER